MGTLDLSTDSRLTHFSIWFGGFPFRVKTKRNLIKSWEATLIKNESCLKKYLHVV